MMRKLSLELSLLAMEACWLYAPQALVAGLSGGERPFLSLPATVFLLAAAFYGAGILGRLRLPLRALQTLFALMALALVLVVAGLEWNMRPQELAGVLSSGPGLLLRAPGFLLALAVGTGLWWRGMSLAQSKLNFDYIFTSFRVGLALMAASLLMATHWARGELAFAAPLFFATGLLALAMARLEQVEKGRRLYVGGYWLGILMGSILLVAILGSLMGLFAGLDLSGLFAAVIRVLGDLLFLLFYVLFVAIGFLVQFLFWLASRLMPPWRGQLPLQTPASVLEELKDVQERAPLIPPYVADIMRWGFLLLAAALILLLLARAFRLRRLQPEGEGMESRESLWSREAFLRQMRELAAALLAPWRRRGRPPPPLTRPKSLQGRSLALQVRRLYLRMLAQAASHGCIRRPWETPFEFQAALEQHLGRAEVSVITQAYVRVRYGLIPPSAEEWRALRQVWRRLRGHASAQRAQAED